MYLKKNMNLFLQLILYGILSLFPIPNIAAEAIMDRGSQNSGQAPSKDDEEYNRLMQILDKHTEIATRSKMNADYVPGMVTVLDGKDLLARGMRDVGDALHLVPGIEVISGSFGNRDASVRGLSLTTGSGSNQFMVNGIPLNTTFAGSNIPLFEIPIEQVERIEVIRGPGSAVHGEYANTGVINIIIRNEGNTIYGEGGKYSTYGAGALFSWSDPRKDLHLSMNLAGRESDGADPWSGPDRLYRIGQGNISNAPGPANEDRSNRSGFFNLGYKDFNLITEYLKAGHGDYFGSAFALPMKQDGIVYETTHWVSEANKTLTVNPSLKTEIKIGFMRFEQSSADRVLYYPPGFQTPAFEYPFGIFSALYYTENRITGALNLTWDGWDPHKIFMEGSTSQTSQGHDTWREGNYIDLITLEPSPTNEMIRFDGGLIGKNRKRIIKSLVLQDEYSLIPAFTITAGLRYDQYNDIDSSLVPRIAGVWCISDAHIIKAQYAEAYRPPTFLEIYYDSVLSPASGLGDKNPLEVQTSENFELGYIYRSTGRVFRITLFHTDLENIILLNEKGIWENINGARLRGVELELEQPLSSYLKLDTNISFSDTLDKDTGKAIPGTANWLGNVGILIEALRDVTLNVQYRYLGEQNRELMDPRKKVKAFHTIDVTGNFFNLCARGLTFRLGVRNLFDEDLRYAAPVNTYPEDFPQPGRRWWCEISYEF